MTIKNSAGDVAASHSAKSIATVETGYRIILSQLSPRSQALFELLGRGRQSSTSSSELARYFKTDQRGLRQIVRDARCEGLVICSSVNGYFLPKSREEVQTWYRTAHAKAISGLEPLKSARMVLELPEGQREIEGLN